MRYTIKGAHGLIDCGGTVADLGMEEYQRRYRVQLVPAHIKLSEYEDIDEDPKQLAKLKQALEIIKDKRVDYYQDIIESWSYEEYLDNFTYQQSIGDWKEKELLTKEEYNLLKEVLL